MLFVALKEIWHSLFVKSTRSLGARRTTEGSFVFAQSYLYLKAICFSVLRYYKEELLRL
jgi:hypothetical protein